MLTEMSRMRWRLHCAPWRKRRSSGWRPTYARLRTLVARHSQKPWTHSAAGRHVRPLSSQLNSFKWVSRTLTTGVFTYVMQNMLRTLAMFSITFGDYSNTILLCVVFLQEVTLKRSILLLVAVSLFHQLIKKSWCRAIKNFIKIKLLIYLIMWELSKFKVRSYRIMFIKDKILVLGCLLNWVDRKKKVLFSAGYANFFGFDYQTRLTLSKPFYPICVNKFLFLFGKYLRGLIGSILVHYILY